MPVLVLQPARTDRRAGQTLVEAIVGIALLTGVVMGIITAVATQSRAAALLARESRVRLLLEGEMEWMRGRPGSQIAACQDEEFMPVLGVPEGIGGVRFRRTVAVDGEQRLAHVTLAADFGDGRRRGRRVATEGVLWLGGQEP